MVRWKKSSSGKGTSGGEHERGDYSPSRHWVVGFGVSPEKIFEFWALFFFVEYTWRVAVFLCRSDNFDIRYCFYKISDNFELEFKDLKE